MKLHIIATFILINLFLQQVEAQKDTTIFFNKTRIDIRFPTVATSRNLLVLPGWNFSPDDICKKSDFCSKALSLGYTLILPDMQKSVYHSVIFPEMRADRYAFHTLVWFTDSLIPYLNQEFKILKSNQKNYVLGISTGGRGVALLVEKTGKLFRAGAALSGDYDQTLMPADRLMQSYYGNYNDFQQRWQTIDNPCHDARLVQIPLFLAHGDSDKVVPVQQTRIFYQTLKEVNPQIPHQIIILPNAGHDYNFWSSQFEAIFRFFNLF